MKLLQDKVAIITGSGRGIGAAAAKLYAEHGAKVIVTDIDPTPANLTAQAITEAGGTAIAVPADVTDAGGVEELVGQAVHHFGGVDILVNNAGTTRDNVIMMLKPEDFDVVINTNLRSAWLCSKVASRAMMRKRTGRIINITSVVGISGNGGQTNYAASKAGMIGLTKSLAKEVATRGITVNAVAPGFIETAMTEDLSEDVKATALSHIPLGRMGQPEDVAKAVAFLASDDAEYITGQVLVVDGGMVM
ncbi:MAG: 3-oxoacyl-[acyl-carrier-protein] reductase [Anaerolineae bacterium]|nr:3-oxoacyl-[acyl-carrier-protein] reductase [Anaerolineae bacterium]